MPLLLLSAPLGQTQDPEVYRQQANADALAATTILTQAEQLLQGNMTRARAESAVALYARAGKLFEKAAGVYENLGPQYSRPEDATNARQAMDLCMRRIHEIKQRVR